MRDETTESERVAVGCAIYGNPQVTKDVLALLRPDELADARHRSILQAAHRLSTDGQPCDPITVLAELRRFSEAYFTMADLGPYLHDLIAGVPSLGSATYYARAVREEALRRRALQAGARLEQAAQTSTIGTLRVIVSQEMAALSTAVERAGDDA